MVYVSNVGFQSGSFAWYGFQMVNGQVAAHTTGSDEDTPLLLVNPEGAWNHYGCNPTRGGSCPKHGGFVSAELYLNPLNRYFYLLCPLDATVYRYLNSEERLDDLQIVRSSKKTEYDQNIDFPSNW